MLDAVLLFAGCANVPPEDRIKTELVSLSEAIVGDYGVPGITVAVAGSDGVTSIAVGLSNREAQTPMVPETTMLAASIGKTFVAATVLRFSEEKLLDLDDPISRWLGAEAWFDQLPNGDGITIRHLLQHRSGLPDHVHMAAFGALWPDMIEDVSPENLIALTFGAEPIFPAGSGWSYTDTGYLLLGLIIERVSSERYEDIVQVEFLDPLALSSTGPSNRKDLPGLARGYVSGASGLAGLPPRTTDDAGLMTWHPAIEWTGGGLYSTSHDLAVWGRAFLSGKLFEAETFAQAIDGISSSSTDLTSLYGLGIAIRSESRFGPAYGHRGWIPGYVSSLQYYPDHDIAIAFQINTDIGIVDAERPIVLDIEERLAGLLLTMKGVER
ncbi:MAG: serine hydrolase domain-containing protein [Hyphomonas sp.]